MTSLAILAALVLFFVLGALVGAARGKYGVAAPACTGNEHFERRYRVHMNTLEQLVLFLPAIVLAAPVLGDEITAALGLFWSVGRIVFARAYYADPAKRSLGFVLTITPWAVLLIAAAWGAIATLT